LNQAGLSSDTVNVMMSSISSSSRGQYQSALNRWEVFCSTNNCSPFTSDIKIVLDFLTSLYKHQLGYSALNTTRSALSLILGPIDGFTVGTHPLVSRFLKAVGRLRPPKPKYNSTWDVNSVLNLFRGWPNNSELSLRALSQKLVGLLALVTAQRVQTLHAIKLSSMKFSENKIEIFISSNIKTSKPGGAQPCLLLVKYLSEEKLCVVDTVNEYLLRTSVYRKHDQLLLSFESPYSTITTQTISRWLKMLLNEANVDVSMYKAHSFRHASTSKAYQAGVSADVIFAAAGWSRNSLTFAKFYNKKIDDKFAFADSVLARPVNKV